MGEHRDLLGFAVGAGQLGLPGTVDGHVDVFSLLTNRRTYAGTQYGGIRENQEMLDFCAEHDIAAEIELISADKINDAYERVLRSDVRYSFVLDNTTLN